MPMPKLNLVLLGAIGVLALAGNSACQAAPANALSPLKMFRQRSEVILPFGTGEADVGLVECEDCADGCTAGFVFTSRSGTLCFYDAAKNNLKLLSGLDSESPAIEVKPGPPVESAERRPYDGSFDNLGNIYLIADTGRLSERFILSSLSSGQNSWVTSMLETESRTGTIELEGRIVQAAGGVWLSEEPDGSLTLFEGDVRASRIEIARGGKLLRAEDRRTVGVPLPNKTKALALNPVVASKDPGRYIGADLNGGSYFFTYVPRAGYFLRSYDNSGSLRANMQMELRPILRPLAGKDSFCVLPDGCIAEARVVESGLSITIWELR